MKKLLVLFVALFFIGCGKLEEDLKTHNENIKKQRATRLIKEIDGCKIYRTYDEDACIYIYFTNCTGSIKYQVGSKHKRDILSITE